MIMKMSSQKKQPHIAIFNIAALGHINPTISTVKELVSRGYRISYVTSSEFADRVESAGAKPVIFEPFFNQRTPMSSNLKHVGERLAKQALENYPKMMTVFNKDRPDIIAYDFLGWHGKALAHHWGIPSVLLSPTHVNYEGMYEDWYGAPLEKLPFLPILEKMLHDNKLELEIIPFMSKNKNSIAYFLRSFQEKLDTIDPSTIFVGIDIAERDNSLDWTIKTTNKPTVFISLGTIFNNQPSFFKTCIKAFTDKEWHVVLAIGYNTKIEELDSIPANVEIHHYVPQLKALQSANLFITHAGMNSTMEALHFGVPMIAVPQMAEQCTNALRIQSLGLGRYLPQDSRTAPDLFSAAQEVVSNPVYKQNILRLQEEIKSAGGAKAAADVFDRIMENMH